MDYLLLIVVTGVSMGVGGWFIDRFLAASEPELVQIEE